MHCPTSSEHSWRASTAADQVRNTGYTSAGAVCAVRSKNSISFALKRSMLLSQSAARRMARPREFDEEAVLKGAMNSFWERRYEATSVRDLAMKMGIIGPSLDNAFGDKRSFFCRVLERYSQHSCARTHCTAGIHAAAEEGSSSFHPVRADRDDGRSVTRRETPMALLLYDLAGAEIDRRFNPYCWRTRMALAQSPA